MLSVILQHWILCIYVMWTAVLLIIGNICINGWCDLWLFHMTSCSSYLRKYTKSIVILINNNSNLTILYIFQSWTLLLWWAINRPWRSPLVFYLWVSNEQGRSTMKSFMTEGSGHLPLNNGRRMKEAFLGVYTIGPYPL